MEQKKELNIYEDNDDNNKKIKNYKSKNNKKDNPKGKDEINQKKKYNLNYEQKEIYIQEYLIKNIYKETLLPGITFLIPNQSKLQEEIKAIIGNDEYKKFIDIANITEEYRFLGFKKLIQFNPKYHIPEFNNYIILVDKNKNKYFMDYLNRKKINLTNGEKEIFDEFSLSLSEVYLVSVLPKNLTFEEENIYKNK